MFHKTREVFAWFPVWLEDINEQGYRVKIKKVWLCKVKQFDSLWDGWIAFVGDNKHLM